MNKKDLQEKLDELKKELDAVKEEDEEETEEEETEEDVEKEIQKRVDEATKKISASLGLDELKKKVDKIALQDDSPASKIYVSDTVQKDISELTKDEIIVGFFKALVNQDVVTLKALSEGTPADGGYLFPDEFRAELLKNLEAPTRMRGLVRVIPMKRDIMNIPKLGSRPHVRWTAENSAKSTTTADFEQKTLTAYKVAAIKIKSGIVLRNTIKNVVNCWELLTRTISSQAIV